MNVCMLQNNRCFQFFGSLNNGASRLHRCCIECADSSAGFRRMLQQLVFQWTSISSSYRIWLRMCFIITFDTFGVSSGAFVVTNRIGLEHLYKCIVGKFQLILCKNGV